MTHAVPDLEAMTQRLLDEIAAGNPVRLEITAPDAAGSLLRLILLMHQAARQRQVEVVVDQVSADTIRLSVPGDA
jgi:hypothetical protein